MAMMKVMLMVVESAMVIALEKVVVIQLMHTSHLTPYTSHLTPRTSHSTPHTSHHTPQTSHLTPHTSHLTGNYRHRLSVQDNVSRRPHRPPAGATHHNGFRVHFCTQPHLIPCPSLKSTATCRDNLNHFSVMGHSRPRAL